ncbi:MAG: gamma-glutamyltransferase [Acutalibacteraceae bacterium]
MAPTSLWTPPRTTSWSPARRLTTPLSPASCAKDGKAVGPFGVMGGFMQPQGHLQVLLNTIDFGMNPQEALDAPRFQWVGGKKVQLERAVPTDIALKLAAMGHEVEIMNDTYSMGRGEIIWRWDDEVLVGASEPRCDGHVASW